MPSTKEKNWPLYLYNTNTDVIGVPYNFGQPKPGVENGPKRMRQAGIIDQLTQLKFNINDKGDLSFDQFLEDSPFENVKRPRAVGRANKRISDAVKASVSQKDHSALVLGGDHSMAIGSIHGDAQVHHDLGIIWVDAHADLNPPLKSWSGNVHGMPLAFVAHELHDQIPKGIPEFEWLQSCISLKNVSYIGLRDLDQAEKEIIKKYDIKAFTMEDVNEFGIAKVTEMAIEAVSPANHKRPIHLSFDIDALDISVAPSTGTAVVGGLSLREGMHIVSSIAAERQLTVMDLAEVNPDSDCPAGQHSTLAAACELVGAWFGKRSKHLLVPN